MARSAPDGYTIMMNPTGHATNPVLMKLPFDPIKDFAFVQNEIVKWAKEIKAAGIKGE